MPEKWIVIPNWDKFQHRDAWRGRRPIWIKVYTEVLDKQEYRDLPMRLRGLLHDIWMLYALTDGQLKASPASLARRLHAPTEHEAAMARQWRDGGETLASSWRDDGENLAADASRNPAEHADAPLRLRDLKRLEQAGFICITDAKKAQKSRQRLAAPASKNDSLEERREENPPTPLRGNTQNQRSQKRNEPNQDLIRGTHKCPRCNLRAISKTALADHIELAHAFDDILPPNPTEYDRPPIDETLQPYDLDMGNFHDRLAHAQPDHHPHEENT